VVPSVRAEYSRNAHSHRECYATVGCDGAFIRVIAAEKRDDLIPRDLLKACRAEAGFPVDAYPVRGNSPDFC
jgi:hypothetical protein